MLNLVQLAIADLRVTITKSMTVEDGNQLLFRLQQLERILAKNVLDDQQDKDQLALLLFYVFIYQSHQHFAAQFNIVLNAKECLRQC
jgi:hypothetical protein